MTTPPDTMPDEAWFQMNKGYGSLEQIVGQGDQAEAYVRKSLATAREAALMAVLNGLLLFFEIPGENSMDRFERVAAIFYKETGYLRPGKDCCLHDPEIRQAAWSKWVDEKVAQAQAQTKGGKDGQ